MIELPIRIVDMIKPFTNRGHDRTSFTNSGHDRTYVIFLIFPYTDNGYDRTYIIFLFFCIQIVYIDPMWFSEIPFPIQIVDFCERTLFSKIIDNAANHKSHIKTILSYLK